MNYMAKVAEMLGVELNEKFKIEGSEDKFKLTEHGLILTEYGLVFKDNGEKYRDSEMLTELLTGKAIIKRKPWVPKMEETYYYWLNNGGDWHIRYDHMEDLLFDLNNIAMGNCFRTRDDAEAHKDEVIKRYEAIGMAVTGKHEHEADII